MSHIVEVDQSIKIEQSGDTVLAVSNGISHAIIIPSDVKREGLRVLREKKKRVKQAPILLFAACLYLLLKDHLPKLQRVIIDTEYTGQENNIKSYLLGYIKKDGQAFSPENIVFSRVGKSSPADKKARAVREKQDNQYRKVTLEELLRLIK